MHRYTITLDIPRDYKQAESGTEFRQGFYNERLVLLGYEVRARLLEFICREKLGQEVESVGRPNGTSQLTITCSERARIEIEAAEIPGILSIQNEGPSGLFLRKSAARGPNHPAP